MRVAPLRWSWLEVAGGRLRYAVTGRGPAVLLPKKDRPDYGPARTLADRYTLIQVEPLGFGRSDRPDPHPQTRVRDQLLAVCDAVGIEEFAVWGYSQGGAMACTIAVGTPRVRALVCGGFDVLREPTRAWLDRMNRQRRVPEASRAFWNDFSRFDWHAELRRLQRPVLMYTGDADPHRIRPANRLVLEGLGVDVVGFAGLDHRRCGLTDDSPATPTVADWLTDRL